MSDNQEEQAFAELGPADVLDAVESVGGLLCDGRLLALNSYENRVYQVGIEDAEPVVAKFYRPGRWSNEAIREEHGFTRELYDDEIPVIPPIADAGGETLFRHGPFRFALFPRRGGRPPDLEDPAQLEQLGRFLARLHNRGATHPFEYRPALDVTTFGEEPFVRVMESGLLPPELETPYRTLVEDLLGQVRACYERAAPVALLRLHGDCHPGNILWRDGPHLVDLDDARMGPAIQDLWMFLSGDRAHRNARLTDVLVGYTDFRDFEPRELQLIEALRTLRLIHYAAWLARRWSDPAFPRAFPWFASPRFWEEHILSLREQAAAMDEPPLVWD